MELDASIEPTIGPYEVYEDEWFAAKAAFEAFITLRDDAETAKLTKFSAQLQGLENRLPIDPALRNPKLGALSPIRVVNVVFSAGDGNRGVQTAAFNLPNDERVVQEKGTKRTMLKNTQEAKFRLVLQPIAKQALSPADQGRVQFDAFFTHILMHELMHGLGPNSVTVNGQTTTVRAQLKETYSTLEEAKADISGLWALQTLVDDGVIDKSLGDTMYVDVPGVGVPLDPLRHDGGARPRHRHPAEHAARRRRVRGQRRRHVPRRADEDPRRREGADDRDHDGAGQGRLRRREGADGARDDPAARSRSCSTGSARVPVDIEPRFTTAAALMR